MKHKCFKTIVTLLIFTLLLTITGCSKKPTAEELLAAADAKHKELTDTDMSMIMDMKMTQGENSLGMTMDMDMQMTGLNTEEMLYYANMVMTMDMEGFNESIDMITFYKDGYCYNETLGQKMKYSIDLDAMMETIQSNTATANINTEFMTDLVLTEEGDNYIIAFNGDPDKMNEYVESVLGSMNDLISSEDTDFVITDISGEMTINEDGYYIAEDMIMVFEMDVPVEGELPLTITADIHADFNNPGQSVEVTIPENLDEYIEIDATLMEGAL